MINSYLIFLNFGVIIGCALIMVVTTVYLNKFLSPKPTIDS